MTEKIFSPVDIAAVLCVTKAAVSNYRTRYDDTPEPAFETVGGQLFWTAAQVRDWQRWQQKREGHSPNDGYRDKVLAAVEDQLLARAREDAS